MKTLEELEAFMLKHGENIIDTLGAEVDRLEKDLKVKFSCFLGSAYSVMYFKQYHCSSTFWNFVCKYGGGEDIDNPNASFLALVSLTKF